MRKAMLLSGLLHAAIIAIAVIGLPRSWQRIEIIDQPIPVEIVDIGALTNVPRANRPPEKIQREAKRDEPKPEPRETPPERKPREPRVAAPTQPPKVEKAAKKPVPKPEPLPEKKPAEKVKKPEKKPVVEAKKPAPEPKPKSEPRRMARIKARPPQRKPAPPSDFTSVLKTVEKIRRTQRTRDAAVQRADRSTRTDRGRNIPDQPLTISELDAIRRQFISCWNVDVGAPNIAKMIVSIRVDLNADRTVRAARVLSRMPSADPVYRAFVESALRAVRNPRCSPVRLPPKKFQMLREFTLRFSAKEMLGL